MSHRRKRKRRIKLPLHDAGILLHQLAEQVARGDLSPGAELSPDSLLELKESQRERDGTVCLKLRLKMARAATSPSRPSYKELKKRMRARWRELRALIERGEPLLEQVRSFHADCQTMVSFPGKGDPDYQAFREAADQLLQAAESGQRTSLRSAASRLDELRHHCHRRYR